MSIVDFVQRQHSQQATPRVNPRVQVAADAIWACRIARAMKAHGPQYVTTTVLAETADHVRLSVLEEAEAALRAANALGEEMNP